MLTNRSPDFDRAKNILIGILELVKLKDKDYGQIPYITGKIGIANRILEKAMRLYNLTKKELKGEEPAFKESLNDTINDIIGYCLVWFAYFGGEENE